MENAFGYTDAEGRYIRFGFGSFLLKCLPLKIINSCLPFTPFSIPPPLDCIHPTHIYKETSTSYRCGDISNRAICPYPLLILTW